MDDRKTRDHIQAHADAVVSGDMDTVVADLSEKLRPQAPELANALPLPVTQAEVLSVDVGDAESVATIRYTGAGGELTYRTRWQDDDAHPVIVHIEPVA